jgi:hypothetical protein
MITYRLVTMVYLLYQYIPTLNIVHCLMHISYKRFENWAHFRHQVEEASWTSRNS